MAGGERQCDTRCRHVDTPVPALSCGDAKAAGAASLPLPPLPASGAYGTGCGCGGSATSTSAATAFVRSLPPRRRHPARLVGDAIDLLGKAQDNIRGKSCRKTIAKARNILIGMLDGSRPELASCGRNGRSGNGGNNNNNAVAVKPAKKTRRRAQK